MNLFRSQRIGPFTISFYDRLFIGIFVVLFALGLWGGRSGWGARHVGGGVAYAAGYNQSKDQSAYKPLFGGQAVDSTLINAYQSVIAQYEQQTGKHSNQYNNVRVLKGYNYNQFSSIMLGQMSGGLGVGCQYCHQIGNYRYDTATKKIARAMVLMTRYINSTIYWKGSHLPAVSCQTCHLGKAIPQIRENDPTTARYPIDPQALALVQQYSAVPGTNTPAVEQNSVTAARLLLRTMAKWSTSLGVGCTYCHNSRNFASYEVQNKTYAVTMLGMLQSVDSQYLGHLKLNGKQLPYGSCYMCHRAYQIPPGAVPYNSLYAFQGDFPSDGLPGKSAY